MACFGFRHSDSHGKKELNWKHYFWFDVVQSMLTMPSMVQNDEISPNLYGGS